MAEKVHAYTGTYGGSAGSSRVKDLVDLVLVKSFASLDAKRLHASIVQTFEGRGKHALPEKLPPPPPDWGPAFRKLASEVGIDPEVKTGHAEAATLIDPVLAGRDRGRWSPDRSEWINT